MRHCTAHRGRVFTRPLLLGICHAGHRRRSGAVKQLDKIRLPGLALFSAHPLHTACRTADYWLDASRPLRYRLTTPVTSPIGSRHDNQTKQIRSPRHLPALTLARAPRHVPQRARRHRTTRGHATCAASFADGLAALERDGWQSEGASGAMVFVRRGGERRLLAMHEHDPHEPLPPGAWSARRPVRHL